MITDVMRPSLGSKTGCFSSYYKVNFLILPATRRICFLSRNGSDLKMLLCLEVDLPLHNALISFSKYLPWHNLITATSAVCTEHIFKCQALMFDTFCLSWLCRIPFHLSIIFTTCFIFFLEHILFSAFTTILLLSILTELLF